MLVRECPAPRSEWSETVTVRGMECNLSGPDTSCMPSLNCRHVGSLTAKPTKIDKVERWARRGGSNANWIAACVLRLLSNSSRGTPFSEESRFQVAYLEGGVGLQPTAESGTWMQRHTRATVVANRLRSKSHSSCRCRATSARCSIQGNATRFPRKGLGNIRSEICRLLDWPWGKSVADLASWVLHLCDNGTVLNDVNHWASGHTNPLCNNTCNGARKKAPTAMGTSLMLPPASSSRSISVLKWKSCPILISSTTQPQKSCRAKAPDPVARHVSITGHVGSWACFNVKWEWKALEKAFHVAAVALRLLRASLGSAGVCSDASPPLDQPSGF